MKRKLRIKMWAALLAVACLMMVSFSGCYVVKLAEVMGDKTLESQDGEDSITMTAGWRDAAGELNDYAVLEAAVPAKEKYVAVIPYTKEELEGDMTLEDVTDILVQEIAGGVTGGTVSEESTVQIAGRSASIARVDGTVDNLKVTYWISCLETDDSFVEILGWTLANRANANKKDIQSVMCSLQVN